MLNLESAKDKVADTDLRSLDADEEDTVVRIRPKILIKGNPV